MAKKPSLTVVGSNAAAPGVEPPHPLGRSGRSLWDRIQREFVVDDAGGMELLAQICAMQDMIERLERDIDANGATIRCRTGAIRANPLIKDLMSARSFICRNLQRLGINYEPVRASSGRPPGTFGP